MGVVTETAWQGAEALRPFLVPIDQLEPFPGNPRRGNLDVVRGSLTRFGQVKPVVVDGSRIVAGHHVVQAALELGWSHVGVVENRFATEDEARAYLLADNRSSDLGEYDPSLLAEQLRILADADALTGTGYGTDDLDELLASIGRAGEDTWPEQSTEPPDPMRRSELREVVLLYSAEQLGQVEAWLKAVAASEGTGGASETVYSALGLAVAAIAAR